MEDKKSTTRKQILNAAFICFSQFGYSKTTFGDVAKRAGISRALIYSYFKSKEELFFTMTDEKHSGYIHETQKVLNSSLSKREQLLEIIDIWIIDPYRVISKSPVPNAWLDQLKSVAQSELLFRNLFTQALTPLLGQALAEVIVLSFRGLLDDRPEVTVLENRTAMLVNCLRISPE